MKIITVLGTRPEIIRLSCIMPLLDKQCKHVMVYTGQNYDKNLKDVFFQQLKLRDPDYSQDCSGAKTPMEQISRILCDCESIFKTEKPDKILILGDTNSALCAFVAKRMGIPVYHMEAGNRCFDDRVPEEVNRRIIDHSSTILMPYTERSRDNLIAEGIESRRIYVTGNPIREVIENNVNVKKEPIQILNKYGVESKKFFLVTLHRQENVDNQDRLTTFVSSLNEIQKKYDYPMLFSVHPRTRKRLEALGSLDSKIKFLDPMPFFDFIGLELSAFCMLSDSGTVQEEACIYNTPCVTLRDTTERPETIECGSNILTGCGSEKIINAVDVATTFVGEWKVPIEYMNLHVSEIVLRILLG